MSDTLEADGIQLRINGRDILRDVYLRCETGRITALLGRNGAGKSCLMRIIHGSLPCEKSVRINGLSVVEPYKTQGLLMFMPQFSYIPKSLSLRRVFSDFQLDLPLFQNRFPEFAGRQRSTIASFSGGERRLIELYLVVKSRCRFVLLDEPFTQLNPLQIEKVKQLLNEERTHKGLLITDHMYRHVMDISQCMYLLADGKTHAVSDIGGLEALGYTGKDPAPFLTGNS